MINSNSDPKSIKKSDIKDWERNSGQNLLTSYLLYKRLNILRTPVPHQLFAESSEEVQLYIISFFLFSSFPEKRILCTLFMKKVS